MQHASRAHELGYRADMTAVQRSSGIAVALSLAIHTGMIVVLVANSGPHFEEPDPTMKPVFYLLPPNRPLPDPATGERLRYVAIGLGEGSGSGGTGDGAESADRERPSSGPDDEAAVAVVSSAPATDEPVFTVVEVDEEAVRVATSAAPAYPEQLLNEGIEGVVIVQYVVEANGFADSSSLRVLSATRSEFADAVRAALPHMRFSPARIGDMPVRQLVEQPFSFRIRSPAQLQADSAVGVNTLPRPQ